MRQIFADRRLWPVAAGVALAVPLTLSPVTVVSCVALALILIGARRGLRGTERTAVTAVIIVAIALRVLAVVALFGASHPGTLISFPFDGDGWYMKQRSLWIRNFWLGVPIGPDQLAWAFQPYGWSSYIYVLAYIQYLLGPAPYALHLLNVVCYVGAAVLLYRLVRASYGPMAALVALLVILFMPTLFMWSISALKEPLFLLLMTIVPVGAVWLVRGSTTRQRIAGIAMIGVAVSALNTVRANSVLIVVGGLGLTLAGTFVTRRAYLVILALLLLLVGGERVLQRTDVQTGLLTNLQQSARLHIGNVHTQGHGYKLLDQRFYSDDVTGSMTWPEGERFALRAFYAFVVVPLPWQLLSRFEVMFLPQQLLWYLLVPLALVGVVDGLRSDVIVTWLFIGMICAGAAAIAPNEGNIGTMVRHRDAIVPFVACLSALGAAALWCRAVGLAPAIGRRRAAATGETPGVPPNPANPANPGFVRRMFASSVVARALARLADRSRLCATLAAIFRPSIGYQTNSLGIREGDLNDVLDRVARSSLVIAPIRRALDRLLPAWRYAAVAAAVERFLALDTSERIHFVGWILLVATLSTAALAPLGDSALPMLWPWAASLACALGMLTLSGPLALAWHVHRASADHDSGRVATTT